METKRVVAMASLDTSVEWLHQTVKRCRSWNELRRRAAWLTRFKSYVISKHQGKASPKIVVSGITLTELRMSTLDIVRLIPKGGIRASEVGRLKLVERDGLLPFGGRVQTRPIRKLPPRGRVTELIVQH